jgi:hypothetical protein
MSPHYDAQDRVLLPAGQAACVLAPLCAAGGSAEKARNGDGRDSYSLLDYVRACVVLSYGTVLECYYGSKGAAPIDLELHWSGLPRDSMEWLPKIEPDSPAAMAEACAGGLRRCVDALVHQLSDAQHWYVRKSDFLLGLGIFSWREHTILPGAALEGLDGYLWTPEERDQELLDPDWRTSYPSVIHYGRKGQEQDAIVFGPVALVNHKPHAEFQFRISNPTPDGRRLVQIFNASHNTVFIEAKEELLVDYFAGESTAGAPQAKDTPESGSRRSNSSSDQQGGAKKRKKKARAGRGRPGDANE